MEKKIVELLEDERARYEGRYYDAGVWMGLNWTLEEAEKEAESKGVSVLEAVSARKDAVFEDMKKAKEALNDKKVYRIGKTKDNAAFSVYSMIAADGAKASLLAGELEGLEKAIEILKEAV